ncbi:MAG: hypothetical protein H7067_00150 [Burkholderiales bacterium]|nr:hypothetical protein [Opitutaceae bacterium]
MNIALELPSNRRVAAVSETNSRFASADTAFAAECVLADSERQPCEVWTRVMGYHRPISSFNTGKQAEHAERRFFATPPCGRR